MPERAIASGSARIQEAESRLRDLINDDQADEESLSRQKRESVKEGYAAMFDSLIELGEKMALVARYGKLLTTTISTEKSPFPATVKPRGESIPLWDGASKTAEVRAALASGALVLPARSVSAHLTCRFCAFGDQQPRSRRHRLLWCGLSQFQSSRTSKHLTDGLHLEDPASPLTAATFFSQAMQLLRPTTVARLRS